MTCRKHTDLVATTAKATAALMAKGRATVRCGHPRLAKILAVHFMRRGAWANIEGNAVHLLLYSN